jgi:tRNA A37 threonylcarbamoyladenosine dehydratase
MKKESEPDPAKPAVSSQRTVEMRKMRFDRCARLLGAPAMGKIHAAHVAVFGLGGVGSFAAEGLARTGVGRLTLVDFDRICLTNINRQLPALVDTLGQSKADLMAARVRAINPEIEVRALTECYDKTTSAAMLEPAPDVVIDCIDNVTAKMHLVATCLDKGISIVTTLGAGAKLDPTRIRIVPLGETHTDPLGRALRKNIRRKHGVTDAQLGRAIAVFSDEPAILPDADHAEARCGVNYLCPDGANERHTCRRQYVIHGAAVFVTSVFGMAAASAAVRVLLGVDPMSRKLKCEMCGHLFGDPTAHQLVRKEKGRLAGKG